MKEYKSIEAKPNSIKFIAKQQRNFIGKCCLIAGTIFALIFAISYVISEFWFLKNNIDFNYLILTGSIALIVSVVLSIIMSFKGMRASFSLIITTILIYSLAFTIMFSAYFSLLGNSIMFFALAFTSIAIFIIGVISFIIPAKTVITILRISMISFSIYIAISLIGSLILWFTFSNETIQIWQIIITSLIGLIIISSTIYSFYNLKKTNEYINIVDLDKNTYYKLMLFQSFNLLSSIMMVFMLILRILGFINRN